MRPRVERRVVALMLIWAAADGWAADSPGDGGPPSVELLEFLGLLVEQDGAYLDPMDLAGLDEGALPTSEDLSAEEVDDVAEN